MFHTILIANRGEIACRVIRTARRMGIRTVAVYSDADRDALHVRMADEAVRLGPPPSGESYLRGDAIIEAARITGAQAIHPGYGFLSENPDFVRGVAAAGLTFVGPTAEAIEAMGLKDAAKRLMEKAGVPVVPGYHGDDQGTDLLRNEAERIGYPVMIKARAGGGGKGMRRVESEDAFDTALDGCRREAASAFGDDAVLIEKFIASPRHVEVQVFGDGRGSVVHLFERDCSLQRRHQKVIEEAPAPGMTEEVRAAMTGAAVRAAEAIGYVGAGTVEFIVDGSGPLRPDGFWFMEMNTRLQVEHPVTEAVTGLDLVEWQLRVAAGEPLPCRQGDIHLDGHAMEARVYAEDPATGFLPATGRIAALGFGPGRIDAGVEAGDSVTPFYDPMIAKVIAHGPDRAAARRALAAALDGTEIVGLAHNVRFLRNLIDDPQFVEGTPDTGLIGRRGEDLTNAAEADPLDGPALACAALSGDGGKGWRLWGAARRLVRLDAPNERALTAEVTIGADLVVEMDGAPALRAEAFRWDGTTMEWSERDRLRRAVASRCGDLLTIAADGRRRTYRIPDPLDVLTAAGAAGDEVAAPMTGLLKIVHVAEGAQVAEAEALGVMEAMKMEYTLAAPRAGRIAQVVYDAGAQVEGGAVLFRLDTMENAE